MPNLIEVQKDSYQWFLDEGLKEVIGTVGDIVGMAGGTATAVKVGKAAMKFKPLKIVVMIIAAGFAIVSFVKLVCKAAFWIMSTSMKLSDWFEIQATYLQINAENLKYRDDRKDSDVHRKSVYQRQLKWVNRFKKLANFFALKDSKATKETEEEERRNRNQRYEDDGYDDGESLF